MSFQFGTRLIVLVSCLMATTAFAQHRLKSDTSTLHPPRLVMADGKPIDATRGNACPLVIQEPGKKVRELWVGQFGKGYFGQYADGYEGVQASGQLRIYPSQAEKSVPTFRDFSFLKAGMKELTAPSG